MKISVSYLKSIYDKPETIKKITQTDADFIHVDLMDGKFVPTNNFTIPEVLSLLQETTKKLDIHLMTYDLETYIDQLAVLKPEYITFHIEATKNPIKIIELIKYHQIKAGIAIKPNTKIENLEPYLKQIDLVLVMSVEPGAGGQSFQMSTIDKIMQLEQYQKENSFLINVDGGINEETIQTIKNEIDIVVSGSFICMKEDFQTQINLLR